MIIMSLQSLRVRIGGGRRSERGSALVELAMVLPLLLLSIVGATDFGRVFYQAMTLTSAARAGATYGGQSKAKSEEFANVQTTAQNAASPLDATAVATQICSCGNDDGSSLSTAPTAGACASGTCPTGQHKMYFAQVTMSATFNTISRYPGIPHTIPITRIAIQRAQ
jgi:Flp pilus assembly protein TadG